MVIAAAFCSSESIELTDCHRFKEETQERAVPVQVRSAADHPQLVLIVALGIQLPQNESESLHVRLLEHTQSATIVSMVCVALRRRKKTRSYSKKKGHFY